MDLLRYALAVASITSLFTLSELFYPLRERLPDRPFSCPICLTYWVAAPVLYYGVIDYLVVTTLAILFIAGIVKTYLLLARLV